GDLPSVRPQPRTMEPGEHGMDLGGKVSIIVGRDTDPAALSDLEALLERPGGPVDVVLAADESTTVNGPRIHLGTTEDNPTVARVLSGLGVEGPAALAPDGYVLATGRDRGPVAVLAGRDVLRGPDPPPAPGRHLAPPRRARARRAADGDPRRHRGVLRHPLVAPGAAGPLRPLRRPQSQHLRLHPEGRSAAALEVARALRG